MLSKLPSDHMPDVDAEERREEDQCGQDDPIISQVRKIRHLARCEPQAHRYNRQHITKGIYADYGWGLIVMNMIFLVLYMICLGLCHAGDADIGLKDTPKNLKCEAVDGAMLQVKVKGELASRRK